MSKVTSKRQVTVPKELADRYAITPGVELEWQAAGDVIRVVPPGGSARVPGPELRLALFDAATARQADRQSKRPAAPASSNRGWTREQLYDRGRAR